MRSLAYKVLLIVSLIYSVRVSATHNRAGEITYKRIPPFTKVEKGITVQVFTYSITVVKYTNDGDQIADRCVDTVYFGDGERGVAPRINGSTTPCPSCKSCNCPNFNGLAVPCGTIITTSPSYIVKLNIYTIIHTYPGAGDYLIRTLDPNRNDGVLNMSNSLQTPFYIESKLVIRTFIGPNSSPVFAFPPIDRACYQICFEHNPGAFDPDGDSLSYDLTSSRGANGQAVTGYQYPSNLEPGTTYSIDPITGLLRWCSPQKIGEYNLAFIVHEWRKNTSGVYIEIGYVLRDMQVIVNACPYNLPPLVTVPEAICIEAGTILDKEIIVTDPNEGDVVTLEGGGGAFAGALPLATLTNTSATTHTFTGGGLKAKFRWQTTCDHIRSQPYYTTFKAQDNKNFALGQVQQVSFNTYIIRVVPPPVKNVTATPVGSSIKISWPVAACNPSTNPLEGYKIYRREDCTPFIQDPCAIDVPVSSGFTLLTQTSATATFAIDDNNGNGLVVGQDYSYLVVAVYKDGTITYASSQVCAKLKRDVPVILNVSVESTDKTAGSIWLRWTRPLKTAGNFDSLAFPGPYQFNLKHRMNPSDVFTTVFTTTANLLYQLDTVFTHKNINTSDNSHEYSVEFIAGTSPTKTTVIGSSQVAASLSLTTQGSDRKISLSWTYKTPWVNTLYHVYCKTPYTNTFVLIATTTKTVYTDSNQIVNRKSYCYKVLSEGKYSDPGIYSPLLNYSQESCATATDLTLPCTPTISIDADCPLGNVVVSWNNVNTICSDDVVGYKLFFKPTINDEYVLIDTTGNKSYSFINDGLPLISGCYAIQSIDSSGNRSKLSPDFCIDNCPKFTLPNIFTPNNDQVNDHFKAIEVFQIKEIDLVVLDRWGNLVYRTKDPYFKWDGISIITKKPVSEGTFFYVCDVFEPRVKGIVKRNLKGWVEVQR